MSMNVTVVGNLTRDPELRFTASGDAVANFAVAVNERVREGDKYVDGEPSYYDVTAWKKFAENVAENLRKGDRVIVIGRMKIEKFAGRDGEQRSKPVITAEEIGSSVRFKGPGSRTADTAQDDIPPF